MAGRDDPPWGLSSPASGQLSLSFLYGLWDIFFFSLLLCVELSIASQQGILAIIYPLLRQPRVPSPFLLDPIPLMRRDF